jgi:hypothetical protein
MLPSSHRIAQFCWKGVTGTIIPLSLPMHRFPTHALA